MYRTKPVDVGYLRVPMQVCVMCALADRECCFETLHGHPLLLSVRSVNLVLLSKSSHLPTHQGQDTQTTMKQIDVLST
jgi:hypothetical protein